MSSSGLSTAAVVLLGVIALGSLLQAVFLLILGRELLAMGKRLDAFQLRLGRDLHPLVADLTRATRNLSAASELTEQQARRIDGLVTTAVGKLVEVERLVEDVLLPPASRVASWVATVRAVFDFYRGLRG
jgi:hypothetical protein